MKKYVLVLALLVSAHGFAATCEATHGKVAQFPKVAFGSVFVSVDGLCVKGDRLYTRSPIEICTEWNRDEAGSCKTVENKILSTSLNWSKEIPDGDFRFQLITGTYPLNYSIPVGYDGEGFHPVCEMSYTIPACL
jgi:hypothetical protein